jgi:hypothetical protein
MNTNKYDDLFSIDVVCSKEKKFFRDKRQLLMWDKLHCKKCKICRDIPTLHTGDILHTTKIDGDGSSQSAMEKWSMGHHYLGL